MKFQIIVDTREQKPYKFTNSITRKLDIGDYSLEGVEAFVAIERKTLDDWIISITKNREKMESKIIKAKSLLLYYAIVIESDMTKMWKRRKFSKTSPTAYINTTLKWSVKYNLPIFLSSNATQGRYITKTLLEGFYNYFCKENV